MGLLTPNGETAPDDMDNGGILSGINPDWLNGPVLTDDQISAALGSPGAAAFGSVLAQPTPQMPGSMDGSPATPIPILGPGGNYLNVVYQPGTEQAAGGLVSLASLLSGAPQISASKPPQSADDPVSDPDDGSNTDKAPPRSAPQVAAAPASQPPGPAAAQANDSGKVSGNSVGDTQPYQIKPVPLTFDQMEPQLQAEIQQIPMPQLPNTSPTAESIDAYLRSKNSPLAGQGANFLKYAQKYNIDPRLMVAISGAETGFGKNITAGQNNAFNLLHNIQDPHNSPFNSWDHAIKGVGRTLTNPGNRYDLSDTASMYKGVGPNNGYCRSGSTCDAGLANLNQFLREQGGDPNSLRYPGR